MENWSWIRII